MADGKIVIAVDADAKQAQKELNRVQRSIETIEARINKTSSMRSPLVEQANQLSAALDSAKAKLYEMQNAAGGASAAQIEAQKENVAALQAEYNRVQSRVEAYDRQLQNANYDLDAAKEKAGALTEQITNAGGASERMAAAAERVEKSMNKFGNRISGLFKRALVFTVLSRGLAQLRTWLGETIMQNDAARASIARLKAALLTLAQPILEVVIPVFVKLVNILTQVVTAIAKFFGMLSGKSWGAQVAAAKGLNAEKEAIEGVGSAAEDASKSMASFDEINQITSNQASGGGGGASGSSGTDGLTPDFSNLDMAEDKLNDILGIIGAIAAGLLAWKIASMFTDDLSKIGGIAIAAAGAFALIYFWLDAWNDGIDLQNFIGMFAGLAALAGGLAIAFGSTAAGIALVIGGLAMLVVGIKDVIENGFNLENTLTIIAGLMAAGIGIGLLTGSWIPVLIAAIASVLVALVSFTGHGEELINGLKNVVDGFGKFFKGVFTGDLKLAAEGAKQIWEGLKQTWNAIINSIKDAWNKFIAWLESKNPYLANVFRLAGKLVADVCDGIVDILKGVVDFLAGVFTLDVEKALNGIKEIFKGVWNGIVAIVELAVNGIIEGVNLLISALNLIHFDIPDWVPLLGGKSFGINIPPVSYVQLPRLAQGAVIPPNREFLAVLGDQKSGTNIETPLATMVQAFKQAMNETGGMGGRQITVVMQLDHRELGRAVYNLNNEETQRVGVKLAGVKA